MKRIAVVCLHDDQSAALERLRDLGSVHVTHVSLSASEEQDSLQQRLLDAQKALSTLESREDSGDTGSDSESADRFSGEELAGKVLSAADRIKEAEEELREWQRCRSRIEPWGSFSGDAVEQLRSRGLQVVFCTAKPDTPPSVPRGAVCRQISVREKTAYFVVIAPEEAELGDDLPTMVMPEVTRLDRIDEEIRKCRDSIDRCSGELDTLCSHTDVLGEYLAALKNDIQFVCAREGMGKAGPLTYLRGYVPAKELTSLSEAAAENGWALRYEKPDPDDQKVPTLITVPALFRISKPIFDFIGISPGYYEADVSVVVLLFLTAFFGMIVGDAGYGIIFLGLALAAKMYISSPKARLPINLFIVLSTVTVIWGGLNGNFFAIPPERLPRIMRGLNWFTDDAVKNQHIQWICFFIGALQLSLARGWQAIIKFGRRQFLGEVGWALLIWGNFFTAIELIVEKGSFPRFAYVLYGVGVLLILGCGIKWTEIRDVLNLPFDFMGSFVDVLSYIRLFAVGLSSYFIAASFNDMGRMICDLSPWLIPGAVLVVVAGHLLNVALAFMGVLVHGIRLNTLEFSNHMGLTWGGIPYAPLRNRKTG